MKGKPVAQKVQVLLVDDLDGGEADETVTFALDGVTYQAALLFEQPFDLGRASGAPNGYQLPTNPLGVAVAVGSQLPGSQEPAPSPLLESPK